MIAHLLWALAAAGLVGAHDRRHRARAARAGHEIRGPLSVARLALAGLERSARVDAIELELRRAAVALDELAGRPRADARSADLAAVVSEATPAWLTLAGAHGASLTVVAGPARVAADPLRVAQACANLVANAVEHGGSAVRVVTSSSGDRARIEVLDDGPGLPEPLPALLAAARGRCTTRGHGLAIADAVARSCGGRLVERPAVQGAHLVLDLPAAPSPTRRRPTLVRADDR